MGKPIIQKMFSYMFILDTKTWIKLSYSWGFVFLMFGVFNEIVRRNFDVSTWVDYKGFIAIVTVVYGVYLYFKFRDKTTLNFK
jgi:intracellular septation protein A